MSGAQQNKNSNPAFASLIKSFQMNLKALVGHTYWNKTKEDVSIFSKAVDEKKPYALS